MFELHCMKNVPSRRFTKVALVGWLAFEPSLADSRQARSQDGSVRSSVRLNVQSHSRKLKIR